MLPASIRYNLITMAITRIIFKNTFQEKSIPNWICPSCYKGALVIVNKSLIFYENANSLSARGHEAWEPEWIKGIFFGLLKCSNSLCNETVVITGNFDSELDYEYNYETNRNEMVLYKKLTPTYFNPPLHIFQLNEYLPSDIHDAIIGAYNIYWIDISSCANKIRIVVELIMDNLKIPKTHLTKNKRIRYKLHERIQLLSKSKPLQAESLMAIKWIGNSGSHSYLRLAKDDILDSFEILEHVTNELYEMTPKRISKLTKTINKRKKPIGYTKMRK
jgi:hypothetical protein